MTVSVVIPTYNRGRSALRLVRSLAEGGPPPLEVVVVDDGSDEGSTGELERYAAECDLVRFLRQENAGPGAARNRGALEARGHRILFLDDHVEPELGLVERHLEAARDADGAWIAGSCPYAASPGRHRAIDRFRISLEEGWARGVPEDGRAAESVNGANLAVDRARFLALGGFEERVRTASAEDYLLGLRAERAGIRVVHRPDLVAWHLDPVDGVTYARRQERYAAATARLPELDPAAARARRVRTMEVVHGEARPADGAVRRVVRRLRHAFARQPFLTAAEIPVRALEAARAPLSVLRPLYRLLVGLRTTRGWRRGRRAARPAADAGVRGGERRPSVAALVVSWNSWDVLDECLEALKTRAPEVDVRIVDNASADGTARRVRGRHPEVTLVENDENVGFARANNQLLEGLETDYAVLVNSDAVVEEGAIGRLVDFMERRPLAGLVAGGLVGPDGRSQHPARRFPGILRTLALALRLHKLVPAGRRGEWLLGPHWDEGEPRPVDWVWGTFLCVRMEAYREVGGLDERYHMYGEDIDWAYRMWRSGWEVWVHPEARALHYGGVSAGRRWEDTDRMLVIWDQIHRFLRRNRGRTAEWGYRLSSAFALALEWASRTIRRRPREQRRRVARFLRHQLFGAGGES